MKKEKMNKRRKRKEIMHNIINKKEDKRKYIKQK